MPLRTTEEVVGVLFVSVQLPREIGNQELGLLNTLAEIGGNAIHRTRLHEQTERQLTEAEALRDVERAVASSFDFTLTLGMVAKHAAQRLGADASTVLVHTRRGALLHDIGKLGVPDQILLKPSQLNDDEWVIMRGHPFWPTTSWRPSPT